MRELTLFRCVYIVLAVYLFTLTQMRDTQLPDFSEAWLANGEGLVDAGDYEKAKVEADEMMYADKRKDYQAHPGR